MLLGNVTQGAAVDLTKPKHEAWNVRIAPQIAAVLAEHKRPVVLGIDEGTIIDRVGVDVVICQPVDHGSAAAGVVERDQGRALRRQVDMYVVLDSGQHRVNKLLSRGQTRGVLRHERRTLNEGVGKIQLELGQIRATYDQRSIRGENRIGGHLQIFPGEPCIRMRIREWLIVSEGSTIDSVNVRARLLILELNKESVRDSDATRVDAGLVARSTRRRIVAGVTCDLIAPKVETA